MPVLSLESQTSLTTPALAGTASKEGGNSHATEDMLVVTDYPENLDRVRKILKEVDHRPQQILIEATILSAALTEDNALGVGLHRDGWRGLLDPHRVRQQYERSALGHHRR